MKIDRSFTLSLESDPEFATVVRSAIDMGHGLGLRVVAEGVETAAAASRLREFGCDVAQGYFYAEPMSGESFEIWLKDKPRVPIIAAPVSCTVDDVTDTVSLATF
jgi:EAL domain-containing protein (putative c-di-GMP-specific phosphodiesterase class I)